MNALGWWSLVIVAVALVLMWPRHGAFARARRRAAARTQEHGDNALKHLFHEAQAGRSGSFASLKGTLRLQDRALLRLLERLRAGGLSKGGAGGAGGKGYRSIRREGRRQSRERHRESRRRAGARGRQGQGEDRPLSGVRFV